MKLFQYKLSTRPLRVKSYISLVFVVIVLVVTALEANGDTASIDYYAAPGTVFTKRTDQPFGDLRVDDGGRGFTEETTTIRSVGQHTIDRIAVLAGTQDNYTISVAADEITNWPLPGSRLDRTGLKGLWVSLDGDPDSTLYEIIDNTSHSLVVQSATDLSAYVGKTLVGVIRLDSLSMSEYANLVTDDVLYADTYLLPNPDKLADIPNILLQDKVVKGHLEIGSQIYRSLQADSLTVTDGRVFILGDLHVTAGNLHLSGINDLKIDGTVTVQGNLIVDGTQKLEADGLQVEGDIILTAGTLELDIDNKIMVAGNVLLEDGSVVTVPAADLATTTIHRLEMGVGGTLTIADSSMIDLTEKGYPAGYTIGFGEIEGNVGGSYGGLGGDSSLEDLYGDFRQAHFAGGGGAGAAGGGLVVLEAQSIELKGEGAILVNGGSSRQTGAGGGIHIVTEDLLGTGRIQAQGGASSYPDGASTGSGGRISIYSANISLPEEQISAQGGQGFYGLLSSHNRGGAGTVYLKKADDAGRLLVDSNRITNEYRSPMTSQPSLLRSVGQQKITRYQALDGDRLRIEVAGTPWQEPKSAPDGLGLVGLQVALQADTFDAPLFKIVDNGANWLTVDTSKMPPEQAVTVGDTLIGVVRLQSLKIAGGAMLKTTDRLELLDEQGLAATPGSGLYFGQWQDWYTYSWPKGLKLELPGELTVPTMDLSGADILIAGSLSVDGAMALSDTQITIQGGVSAGEGINLSTAQLTVDGDLLTQGSGSVVLTDSQLDVTGSLTGSGSVVLTDSQLDVTGNLTANDSEGITLDTSSLNVDGDFSALGSGSMTLTSSQSIIQGSMTTDLTIDLTDSQLDITGDVTASGPENMTLVTSQTQFNGSLTLAAGMTLNASRIDANGVITVSGDTGMTLEGSQLIVKTSVNVADDLFLRDDIDGVGSKISVPDAVVGSATLYPLDMVVGGTLTVGKSSVIDLTGKGYPADRTIGFGNTTNGKGGSHAAMGGGQTAVATFGDFHHADFAGSGGYSSAGGGLLNLKAGNIYLQDDGAIAANGRSSSQYSGAGGGLHIETGSLSGTGFIQAYGGPTTSTSGDSWSGSGGRISIRYQNMTLPEDHLLARGGTRATSSVNTDRVGGAGTMYLEPVGGTGRLIVDNDGAGRTILWTPLRSVGSHRVAGTQLLDADRLQITVEDSSWQTPAQSLDGKGLVGLQVDLNADDFAGPFYEIVDNGADWLTIQGDSLDQLAPSGATLIGVIVLDSLDVYGGAALTTEDRLVLNNPLDLEEYTTVEFGQLEGWEETNFSPNSTIAILGDTEVQSLTVSNQKMSVAGELTVSTSLTVEGTTDSSTSLQADSIHIGEGLTVENGDLICPEVEAGGNIYLFSGTEWRVPDAVGTGYYPLFITTPGKLTVGDGAVINLNGKGYDTGHVGPDGSSQTSDYNLLGSHGGLSSSASADGSYGRYQEAMFAGSGGGNGKGGGSASIQVGSLFLAQNGLISANGLDGNGAGAGGGLHFEIGTLFEGEGTISARGGATKTTDSSTSYYSGAGGRISVDIAPVGDKFYGSFDVRGGSYGGSKTAGAGTVYIGGVDYSADDQVYLQVDNGGNEAASGSTPIREVGRFTITDAESSAAGNWTLYTESDHWKPYEPVSGWGIVGNFIDLDPATLEGPYYTIVDNGTNSITIEDPDGHISGATDLLGKEFIGIHRFYTIQVVGGASLDCGADRVIVTDTENSVLDSQSEIRADSDSVLPAQEEVPQE